MVDHEATSSQVNQDAANSVQMLITGEDSIIIEGYLKKHKKYLISSKNFYRVIGKVMHVASNPKKQFKEKYDLRKY